MRCGRNGARVRRGLGESAQLSRHASVSPTIVVIVVVFVFIKLVKVKLACHGRSCNSGVTSSARWLDYSRVRVGDLQLRLPTLCTAKSW